MRVVVAIIIMFAAVVVGTTHIHFEPRADGLISALLIEGSARRGAVVVVIVVVTVVIAVVLLTAIIRHGFGYTRALMAGICKE